MNVLTGDDARRFPSGRRLHAARLLAGYLSASALAVRWEIKDPTYRAMEKGRRRIRPDLANRAAADLQVTREYLLDGSATTDSEIKTEGLVTLLERFEREGYFGGARSAAFRLVRLRHAKNFRFASAAAEDKGWSPATYLDHESNRRNMSVDLAVTYSIGFGVSPSLLLFDEGPGSTRAIVYSRMSSPGAVEDVAQEWQWLDRFYMEGRLLHLPVVRAAVGFGLRLEDERLLLPTRLADLPSIGAPYFAVVVPRGRHKLIFILSPAHVEGGRSLVFSGGEFHETATLTDATLADPFGALASKGHVVVGTILFSLHVRDERR